MTENSDEGLVVSRPKHQRGGAERVTAYNRAMRETVSAKIADVVLPEAGGAEVRLGSLWERTPAVIVFLRHYG